MNFHLSSSPHVRGEESTRSIMFDVCLALLPATAFGVYRFGFYSLLVLIVSIGFAVLSEYMYQNLTKQDVLISDGSAVLTGLLLGLNMPPHIPLWVPALGSMFAIIVVKQFFGGLGRNFMNPALGGRCFLLISFTTLMSDFSVDATSGATPLAVLKEAGRVDIPAMFVGLTTGTIGEISALALLIGGIYLLVKKIITWEIPVFYIGTVAVFTAIYSGFDSSFVFAHLWGGGLMLGAWFMATDYVTSPITKNGKIVFGILLGILTSLFRLFGPAAEGVSYAIIIGNLLVPLIEKVTMPKAFGLEHVEKAKPEKKVETEEAAPEVKEEKASQAPISMEVYKAALNLCMITLVAGLLLGGVYQITKEPIRQAEIAAQAKAFAAVCPQAEKFDECPEIMEIAADVEGTYGNDVISSAYKAFDASGNVNGYVVNVISKDCFGDGMEVSVGFDADGTVTGVTFLSINETAGLGMNATDESWLAQYIGKVVDAFTVTKTGASAENEINAISGATITSKAVTGAVNTAHAAVAAVLG